MKNTSTLSIGLLIALMTCLMTACYKPVKVVSTEGIIIPIDSTLDAIQDSDYIQSLIPLKQEMNAMMGEQIGYCEVDMFVELPESPMINWTSDVLLAEARQHYPGEVDCAIVNVGGIRCEWIKGPVTVGNVYELMPFDNELCVLALTGEDILELCQVFVQVGGEGVSNLTIQAEEGQLIDAQIGGKAIDPEAIYHVATSDYLSTGKDKMIPLANHVEYWSDNARIRDLYIHYIREHKKVTAQKDQRIIL